MADAGFGPFNVNYSLARPAAIADPAGGADTWCVDCSAAGATDGTILDATFFNTIIGNLRYAVRTSGVTLDSTVDTMLYDAIDAIALARTLATITAGEGIAVSAAGQVSVPIGTGALTNVAYGGLDPVADELLIYDASATAAVETTPYDIVRSVLNTSTGVTFNDGTGAITFNAPTHTVGTTPPVGVSVNSTFYDTNIDTLFKLTNDGANDIWIDISS